MKTSRELVRPVVLKIGLLFCLLSFFTSPLLAVTHDDSESMIPEFFIGFRGTGTGTPTLTAYFDAYLTNNASAQMGQYTETVTANGPANDDTTWQYASLYVSRGMPLDQSGALRISGVNVKDYKVFINTPDPKYQPYVAVMEQHLIYYTNVTAQSSFLTTNGVFFKHAGDNGAEAGKVASAMPGWRNFKMSLGYGRTGKFLGYLTFVYGVEPVISDSSQEITLTNFTKGGTNFSQLYTPRMNYDMFMDTAYQENGFTTAATIINCYDNPSQAGNPGQVDANGSHYIDYSGVTPVITYVLDYTNSTGGGNPWTWTKIKRTEGTTVLDSQAVETSTSNPGTPVDICIGGECYGGDSFCFGDGTCANTPQICIPLYCSVVWLQNPFSSFSDMTYGWATAGTPTNSRNYQLSVNTITLDVNSQTTNDTVSSSVGNSSGIASGQYQSSPTAALLPSGNLFFPNLSIIHDSVDGTHGFMTGSANYYWSPGTGSHLKLQYQIEPGGNWTYYEYYDDIGERGMLKRVTRPYTNYPASPVGNAAGAMVTDYSYATNWDGSMTVPLEVTTRLKGASAGADLIVAHSTFDYSASYVSGLPALYEGQVPIWVTERHDYFGPGLTSCTTNITKQCVPNIYRIFANLPVSEQHPDGTKDAWFYETGTYSSSPPTFTSDPGQSPIILRTDPTKSVRTWKVHGFATQVPGAVSFAADGEWVVPNKSTAECETRDMYGRLALVQTFVCSGSSGGNAQWEYLESEAHSYDPAGNLVESFKFMDGEGDWAPVYNAEYTDVNINNAFSNSGNPTGRKQFEWDREGSFRGFAYDQYGRVSYSGFVTLQSNPYWNNPYLNFYTYDADNRILSTSVATSSSDPSAVTSSKSFDLAGLVTNEVQYGYTNTYDYSLINHQVVTKTVLGRRNSAYNRTIITSNYLDGTTWSVSGTAVIPECYGHSVQNVNGAVAIDGITEYAGTPRTVIYQGGKSTTPQGNAIPQITTRSNVTDIDWLGHTVRTESANPNSAGGNLVTTYTYDSNGHLVETTTGSLAPVVNDYDVYGQLFRSGIMLGSGETDLAVGSTDRINEQNTSFYQDGGGAWWEVTTNIVYPNLNDSTPLAVKRTMVQRSGFSLATFLPSGFPYSDADALIPESFTKVIDASGNITSSGSYCDRIWGYNYTEEDSDLTGGNSYMTGGSSAKGGSTKSLTVSGQKIYQQNADGTGEQAFIYDAYNRVGMTINLVAGVDQTTVFTYRPGSPELVWQVNPDNFAISNIFNPEGLIATNIVYTNANVINGGKMSCYNYNLRGQPTAMWGDVPHPATNIYYTSTQSADYSPELEGELYQQETFDTGTWTSWQPIPALFNAVVYRYFCQNGLLLSKTYRDTLTPNHTNSVLYTYNSRGDLASRTWNRGVVTTYAYSEGADGALASVTYSGDPSGINDTPVSYTYNRLGALSTVSDACGTRTFNYRSSDQQLSYQNLPSIVYGSGLTLGLNYDGYGRQSGYWLGTSASSTPVSASYGYFDQGPTDFSGRLSTVTTPVGSFNYSYLPGTPAISTIAGPALDTIGVFNQANLYNLVNGLMTNSVTGLGATNFAAYSCVYDGFHRLSSYGQNGWLYNYYAPGLSQGLTYNDRNELTGSSAYLTNLPTAITAAKPLPRRKLAFAYDADGNRTSTTVDTDIALTYTANNLEQYSSRTQPQFVESVGVAGSNTMVYAQRSNVVFTVTHLGVGAGSNYYFYGQSTRSTTGAGGETMILSNQCTIAGTLRSTDVWRKGILAPPTTQTYLYDQDGNLTNDALWAYTYDDEDRVKQIQTVPSLLTVTDVPPVRLTFTYDFLGRRAQKQVWSYNGSSWTLANTIIFAYDGLNMIAQYHLSGSTLVLDKSFYWGLDKSGTLQGAGGVGGLLAMVTHNTPTVGKYAAINDPWGNVVGLYDVNVGLPMAEYEYTPFGVPLRTMGIMATNNPWRYSTKYYDPETGLLNFGYRYYSASMGRFLNRDPKDELGRLEMNAPLMGGNAVVWSYIGSLVGVPGKSPTLTPNTAASLAESNESEDSGYRDSTETGNIFAHRKGKPSQGGGNHGGNRNKTSVMAAINHPYGFVGNNPYGAFDLLGLDGSDYSDPYSSAFDGITVSYTDSFAPPDQSGYQPVQWGNSDFGDPIPVGPSYSFDAALVGGPFTDIERDFMPPIVSSSNADPSERMQDFAEVQQQVQNSVWSANGVIAAGNAILTVASIADGMGEVSALYKMGQLSIVSAETGVNVADAERGGVFLGKSGQLFGDIPNNATFSGHGAYVLGDGFFKMPNGTSLTVFGDLGKGISADLGQQIDLGNTAGLWSKTYSPGSLVPNLSLMSGEDLNILGNGVTVSNPGQRIQLIQLLVPNMGNCNWSACQYIISAAGVRIPYP